MHVLRIIQPCLVLVALAKAQFYTKFEQSIAYALRQEALRQRCPKCVPMLIRNQDQHQFKNEQIVSVLQCQKLGNGRCRPTGH